MNRSTSHPVLAEIEALFQAKGNLAYGESVNQIEHALQCGSLAEADGAAPALVLAAVLHDVGHMLHRDAATAVHSGADDVHEALGAKFLARWFGPEVSEPVRLHVNAKRYLCAVEPAYWDSLSSLSRRTLEIQGGPMDQVQARAFEQSPHADAAVRLRRWDDTAKRAGAPTPPLPHFLAIASHCIKSA